MFISFEGGEGSGKSTQAEMLVKCLVAVGMQVVPVREPGSTSLGQHLRRYLKDESVSLTREAELLLFCAARAQLVTEVLSPSLIHGLHVVADRYADSTVAYQGYGRGLGPRCGGPYECSSDWWLEGRPDVPAGCRPSSGVGTSPNRRWVCPWMSWPHERVPWLVLRQ